MSDGEAFSRVKIDAQLREAGWTLADGRSVRYEYTLADGTRRFLAAATGAWRKGDERQAIRNVWDCLREVVTGERTSPRILTFCVPDTIL